MRDLNKRYEIGKEMPKAEREPVPDLTPTQRLALLNLRRSESCKRVYRHLRKYYRARDSKPDYDHLISIGLAQRKQNGFHEATVRGHFLAGWLAHALAQQTGLTLYRGTMQRGSMGDQYFA